MANSNVKHIEGEDRARSVVRFEHLHVVPQDQALLQDLGSPMTGSMSTCSTNRSRMRSPKRSEVEPCLHLPTVSSTMTNASSATNPTNSRRKLHKWK